MNGWVLRYTVGTNAATSVLVLEEVLVLEAGGLRKDRESCAWDTSTRILPKVSASRGGRGHDTYEMHSVPNLSNT